jgi:hypothetical protein
MNLVFFNLISFTRAKFSFVRIRVLLVYRLIILKEAKVENIKQELYIDCFILGFLR